MKNILFAFVALFMVMNSVSFSQTQSTMMIDSLFDVEYDFVSQLTFHKTKDTIRLIDSEGNGFLLLFLGVNGSYSSKTKKTKYEQRIMIEFRPFIHNECEGIAIKYPEPMLFVFDDDTRIHVKIIDFLYYSDLSNEWYGAIITEDLSKKEVNHFLTKKLTGIAVDDIGWGKSTIQYELDIDESQRIQEIVSFLWEKTKIRTKPNIISKN